MAPDANVPSAPVARIPTAHHPSIDELDRAIVNLAGRIHAATYDLLVLIRRFDERAGWLGCGFQSCAEWLRYRCDFGLSAAREKVRVAHALKTPPAIGRAFAEGRLSYSKVRALTRVAGPANEDELLAFASSTTAARVEERCRELRYGMPDSTDEAAANRRKSSMPSCVIAWTMSQSIALYAWTAMLRNPTADLSDLASSFEMTPSADRPSKAPPIVCGAGCSVSDSMCEAMSTHNCTARVRLRLMMSCRSTSLRSSSAESARFASMRTMQRRSASSFSETISRSTMCVAPGEYARGRAESPRNPAAFSRQAGRMLPDHGIRRSCLE